MKVKAIVTSPRRDRFKVVMIRTNSIFSDPRVLKEVTSLSNSDQFNPTILAWDREARHKNFEKIGNAEVHRMTLKAPYSDVKVIAYLPIFWIWVLLQLFSRRPDIVHSFDVDAMVPAYIYRSLTHTSRIIFDVCDRFSDSSLFARPIVRPVRVFLAFLEDAFACKADALIVVSQRQLLAFKRARHRRSQIVMNVPNFKFYENAKRNGSLSRSPHLRFRIVHAGTIRGDYGLSELIAVLDHQKDVDAIFAGRIRNRKIINYISKLPNVKFLGELPYEEALVVEASADAIPVLCDPRRPACPQALPNRLFEAMMLGIPVIVNDDLKSAAEIVSSVGCGLVVKYDASSIERAIVFLKENPANGSEMGARGRDAFIRRYNWNRMEEVLLDTYKRLVN